MSKRAYSRASIISRLFNQPLAVLPETASIVLGAVGDRLDVSQLFMSAEGRTMDLAELQGMAADKRSEIEARGWTDRKAKMWAASDLMFVSEGVAHVAVRGETVAENGIGPMSGFTGYDGIAAQVQAADADSSVRGILLDIDSPGGEVAGLYECSSILMARRGTKPMRAIIRGRGASAAYALACCADEITLHDLGLAGSIGTIIMHVDYSEALAKEGVKVTLITAGAHKADGNPFEPLSEEVTKDLLSLTAIANSRFIKHVAAARGMSEDAVIAQQARVYHGEAAVAAGLVDKIMSWQDSMDEFEQQVNGQANRQVAGAPTGARSSKGTNMSIEDNAPAAVQQPESNEAAISAARAEGVTAGASAEQGRILALAELDRGTTLSESFTDAVKTGASAGDFAISQINASKAKAGAALSNLQADAVSADDLPESGAPAAVAPGATANVNRGAAFKAKKATAKAA